ncbi:hypothetical protein [Peptoniphilus sp.]|uniref:hypothetical protein n=1 Tax=Peptoniphilus sp. TaxID=1971214 RepID=UPI003D89FE61
MRKSFLLVLVLLVFAGGFFYNKSNTKNNEGLTKSEMEERLNRKISNEEWKEMTKDGEVEMIGGSDGPTEIYTETK